MRWILNCHSVRRHALCRRAAALYHDHAGGGAHRNRRSGNAASACAAFLALSGLWLGAGSLADAAAAPCPMPQMVSAIADAETLVLSAPIEGTTLVRLAGITAVGGASVSSVWEGKPAWSEAGGQTAGGVEADPVAAAARRMVASLAGDRFVCLDMEQGGGADRYGRLPAQVHTDEGLWLQGRLLTQGLARVRPEARARQHIAEMLSLEEEARSARRGLWQLPQYRVQSSDDVERAPVGLQIVQGRVLKAERRGDWWYLNFGADWRGDFTVMIGKQALPEFARAGVEPFSLTGRTIRVRGLLQQYNGPMIDVLMPEQIEVLDTTGG